MIRNKPLNDEEIKKVIYAFYQYAEKKGYWLEKEEAKKSDQFLILEPQRQIAENMLISIFQKKAFDITISISRQIGKTSFSALTLAFCYDKYYEIFGRGLSVLVIAPEKGTGLEVFRRITTHFKTMGLDMETNTKFEKRTARGDSIEVFGLFEGAEGGTIEGRTFDVTIRDEAHMGDDIKYKDQILPTTFRTDGTNIMIGNGGFEEKYFLQKIEQGTGESSKLIRYNYNYFHPLLKELAEEGIPGAASWVRAADKYIKDNGGAESLMVQKNLFCAWKTSVLSPITMDMMESCRVEDQLYSAVKAGVRFYVAIDWAVSGDKTVMTVLGSDRKVYAWVIVKEAYDRMGFRDQCSTISAWLESYGVLKTVERIGGDNTGMGVGANEIFEEHFGFPIHPITFTQQLKFKMCNGLINSMLTEYEEDKIFFNTTDRNYPAFEKECIELKGHPMPNGTISFKAPEGEEFFDDIFMSTSMAWKLLTDTDGVIGQEEALKISNREKMWKKKMRTRKREEKIRKRYRVASRFI